MASTENETARKRNHRKRRRYEPFTSMEDTKCSRLPSDSLTVPLIYWSGRPKHVITAVLVHFSQRFGHVLITGSESGEFVIWRQRWRSSEDEECDDGGTESMRMGNGSTTSSRSSVRESTESEWTALAISFGSNTTAIVSIMGLTAWSGGEGAFCAVHGDGELVLFSVSGGGALRISRSTRPLMDSVAVDGVYGLKQSGKFWEWALCTDFDRGTVHLLDLKTAKALRGFNVKEGERIVDLAVFHRNWRQFVVIDAAGNLIVFEVVDGVENETEIALRRIASDHSRFRKEAIAVTVTDDDEHIVAVTKNEMAVFSAATLSRIWSKTERNVEWDGMLAIDHLLCFNVVDGDGDGDEKERARALSADAADSVFFIFLWKSNAPQITLYAVSRERALLTPTLRLCVSGEDGKAIKWRSNAVDHDDHTLYIGTADGEVIAFSIDKIGEMVAADCFGAQNVGTLQPIHCGKIVDSFAFSENVESAELEDEDRNLNELNPFTLNEFDHFHRINESRTLLLDDDDNGSLQNDGDDADDVDGNERPSCCCIERTAGGVLLCSGYRSGEVVVDNLTESETALEIHSRSCPVTALLILSIDTDGDGARPNGVLFIGYHDGFTEIFECDSGHNLFAKQTHFGAVDRLCRFAHDFYVFSIGSDHAVCCYLVWAQCVSLKAIMHQIGDCPLSADPDRGQQAQRHEMNADHIDGLFRLKSQYVFNLLIFHRNYALTSSEVPCYLPSRRHVVSH